MSANVRTLKSVFWKGVKPGTEGKLANYREETFPKKQSSILVGLKRYKRLFTVPLSLIRQIYRWLWKDGLLGEIRKLSSQIFDFRGLIRRERISLVVLPADNRYDLCAYVKAAHLEHTGVVLVPQFMAGPLEWAEYVWDQPAYQVGRLGNNLIAKLYPRWEFAYKGRQLIALPSFQVMGRELLGIAPPLPWVLHSGATDFIALESEAVKDYCTAEGLAPEKMIVTGSATQDILFNTLSHRLENRTKLCQDLGFQEDLPLILSALPPDFLYTGRPECDFKTYTDLVKFWCQSISIVKGFNHVVALHPSVRYEDMKYIEEYGLKIAREPTSNVIPLCGIFVASISSTIQWAIACDIPVINYDVYRYRYTDYQNVGGVITVEEQRDFIDNLEKITSDKDYYALIASRQADCAEYWGHLDGKAGERLQELFASTIRLYAKEIQSP